MDLMLIIIIVVGAVAIICLWIALTCLWQRHHTTWLRRKCVHHCTEVLAKRLVSLNDLVEYQLADALERSFPTPLYNIAASVEREILSNTFGSRASASSPSPSSSASPTSNAQNIPIGLSNNGGSSSTPPSNLPPLGRRKPAVGSTLSSAEALQAIVTTCVRRSVMQQQHEQEEARRRRRQSTKTPQEEERSTAPPQRRQRSGSSLSNQSSNGRRRSEEDEIQSDLEGTEDDDIVVPPPSPLDLLANIDAAPELLALCRVAISNVYGAVGRILQIEGCNVFDDVHVVKEIRYINGSDDGAGTMPRSVGGDNARTLKEMQKDEISAATPHATCCCLPLCFTSRRRDMTRFKKYRQLFFLTVGTRFCAAVDVMEPDEDLQKRMVQSTRNNGGIDDSMRSARREKKGRNKKDRKTSIEHFVALSPATLQLPTAVRGAPPEPLRSFEEACDGGEQIKLLHMGDVISRKMIKVTAFAGKRNCVTVSKTASSTAAASRSGSNSISSGAVERTASVATSIPTTIAAAASASPVTPPKTQSQLDNEEAMRACGPSTFRVNVAQHPDLYGVDETREILDAMLHQRHTVGDALLMPPGGGWVAEEREGGEGGPSLTSAATASTSPIPYFSSLQDANRQCEELIREMAAAFNRKEQQKRGVGNNSAPEEGGDGRREGGGLLLVSKAMDRDIFSCEGIRDDLIIFFTNLKRVVGNIGANMSRYNGGGSRSISPQLRQSFPMYDAIQRFDYYCKRWLLQMTVIVSTEAVRAYRAYTRVRLREMSLSAVEKARARIAQRIAAGQPMAPAIIIAATATATTAEGDDKKKQRSTTPPRTNHTPPPPPPPSSKTKHLDPLAETQRANEENANSEGEDYGEGEGEEEDPRALTLKPVAVRARRPKVERCQFAVQKTLEAFVEASHKSFAACGYPHRGALISFGGTAPQNNKGVSTEGGGVSSAGGSGGILVSLEEVCRHGMLAPLLAASPKTSNSNKKKNMADDVSQDLLAGLQRLVEEVEGPKPCEGNNNPNKSSAERGRPLNDSTRAVQRLMAHLSRTAAAGGGEESGDDDLLIDGGGRRGKEGGSPSRGEAPASETREAAASSAAELFASVLTSVDQHLRTQVIRPSVISSLAADEDCKREARRALLSLRESLVDRLCPPLTDTSVDHLYSRKRKGSLSPSAPPTRSPSPMNGTSSAAQASPPSAARRNNSRPSSEQRRRGMISGDFSPRNGGGDEDEGDDEEMATTFAIPVDDDDDDEEGAGHHCASSIPQPLRDVKEASCVYHQVCVTAVRSVIAPTERLVAATISNAESVLAKDLLIHFAPSGPKAVRAWEEAIAVIALPCIRRVTARLSLLLHAAVLSSHVNTLVRFCDGTLLPLQTMLLAMAMKSGEEEDDVLTPQTNKNKNKKKALAANSNATASNGAAPIISFDPLAPLAKQLLADRSDALHNVLRQLKSISELEVALSGGERGEQRLTTRTDPDEELHRDPQSASGGPLVFRTAPLLTSKTDLADPSLYTTHSSAAVSSSQQPPFGPQAIDEAVSKTMKALGARLEPKHFVNLKEVWTVLQRGWVVTGKKEVPATPLF